MIPSACKDLPSSNSVAEEFFLFDCHLTSSFPRPLVLISKKMKNAMDHQNGHHFHGLQTKSIRLAPCRFHRDNQVPQEVGVENGKFSLPHRESKDIGGFFSMEVLPIQFLYLSILHQQDTEFSIRECQFGQYPLGHPFYLSSV
jgi:hypothetical protein